jgi:allantoin racemase
MLAPQLLTEQTRGVFEMDAEPERTRARILEVGGAAARDDGADVIILGCAGLAGQALERRN